MQEGQQISRSCPIGLIGEAVAAIGFAALILFVAMGWSIPRRIARTPDYQKRPVALYVACRLYCLDADCAFPCDIIMPANALTPYFDSQDVRDLTSLSGPPSQAVSALLDEYDISRDAESLPASSQVFIVGKRRGDGATRRLVVLTDGRVFDIGASDVDVSGKTEQDIALLGREILPKSGRIAR